MKKSGIIKKYRIIIIVLIIIVSVLTTAFVGVRLLRIGSFAGVELEPFVDNTERNYSSNIMLDIIGADGKVDFRAYNNFPFSGVYEFTKKNSHRIYSNNFQLLPSVPFPKYSYRGELLDEIVNIDGKSYINYFNSDEHYCQLDCPDGEIPSGYFTTGGELYYYTVTKKDTQPVTEYIDDEVGYQVEDEPNQGLYRLTDKGYEKSASKKLLNTTYEVGYYRNYYYYSDFDFSEDDENAMNVRELKGKFFYKYNLLTKKVDEKNNLDFLYDYLIKNNNTDIDMIMPIDDYIYFKFIRHDDKSKWYDMEKEDDAMLEDMEYIDIPLLYRYCSKTKKFDKIFEASEIYLVGDNFGYMNGYGDKMYFTVNNGADYKGGIYVVKGDGKPELIYDSSEHRESPENLYILDKKWVYFSYSGNSLVRVSSDGKTIEKLM